MCGDPAAAGQRDRSGARPAEAAGRRADRLLTRRLEEAQLRDHDKTLDGFDFGFNPKMDRRLVFELATGRFLTPHDDVVLLGPPGTGKSHLAQALGRALIQQGHPVLYREAHRLLEELADATLAGTRRDHMAKLAAVPFTLFPAHVVAVRIDDRDAIHLGRLVGCTLRGSASGA